MDAKLLKVRKFTGAALTIALLLLTVMALMTMPAAAVGENEQNDDQNDGRPEITIEVVEDIPAAEIEEQEVPLAASPGAAAYSTRHMVIVWTLCVVVIAYAAFIISGMRIRRSRRQIQAGTAGDRGDGAGGGRR